MNDEAILKAGRRIENLQKADEAALLKEYEEVLEEALKCVLTHEQHDLSITQRENDVWTELDRRGLSKGPQYETAVCKAHRRLDDLRRQRLIEPKH
jgi:hypothetical protein